MILLIKCASEGLRGSERLKGSGDLGGSGLNKSGSGSPGSSDSPRAETFAQKARASLQKLRVLLHYSLQSASITCLVTARPPKINPQRGIY